MARRTTFKTLAISAQFVLLCTGLIAACGEEGEPARQFVGDAGVLPDGALGTGGTGGTASGGEDAAPPPGGSGSDAATPNGGMDPGSSPTDAGDSPDATIASDAGVASGGTNGGPTGTQPLGALCNQDRQCSQEQGDAVCCVAEGCSSPCECTLATACPGGNFFIECTSKQDCTPYGGGKVCCEVGAGADVMRFCTKQSGCNGNVLP